MTACIMWPYLPGREPQPLTQDVVSMSILLTKTRGLLANRPKPVTYAHIEAATGLSVRWLEAFASCKIEDPSVSRVELLYTYLSGKPLDV